jgi:hypothetical protein
MPVSNATCWDNDACTVPTPAGAVLLGEYDETGRVVEEDTMGSTAHRIAAADAQRER